MLADHCGFEQALEYVKSCALSDINGDVRLIKKIFFSGDKPADYPINLYIYKLIRINCIILTLLKILQVIYWVND